MTPANDNTPTTRPASFDAAVMQWLPLLRKIAARLVPHQERDDLVNDTIVAALKNWANYRPGKSLSGWLAWQMRACLSVMRQQRGVQYVNAPTDSAVPAVQEDYADLSATLNRLAGTRHGDVVVQRAMGWSTGEIANQRGVSRQRVHQMENAARAELRVAA